MWDFRFDRKNQRNDLEITRKAIHLCWKGSQWRSDVINEAHISDIVRSWSRPAPSSNRPEMCEKRSTDESKETNTS